MLPDYLAPGLKVVMVGTAAGETSAARGHYYSGRGNKFWELIWEAGLTGDRILVPEQDSSILTHGVGLTDIAKGVAASTDTKLARTAYDVPSFLEKLEQYRPVAVGFNGKTAAQVVARSLGVPPPDHGPTTFLVGESRAYVLPSSSGSNNDPRRFAPKASKEEWWQDFGRWLRGQSS